jgi:hypothetical protein
VILIVVSILALFWENPKEELAYKNGDSKNFEVIEAVIQTQQPKAKPKEPSMLCSQRNITVLLK